MAISSVYTSSSSAAALPRPFPNPPNRSSPPGARSLFSRWRTFSKDPPLLLLLLLLRRLLPQTPPLPPRAPPQPRSERLPRRPVQNYGKCNLPPPTPPDTFPTRISEN
ncbi:hypothetical protein WMY93_023733 [Mugilogobius chulae]|uniref:Uncharacterized protein n=1 Tax=Mugilogobius chulae TaxID=88201 RepID=A0AAW0N9I7_9GOBI